jgi:hypothetical protein
VIVLTYDELLKKYCNDVRITEKSLPFGLKGAYSNDIIFIEKRMSSIEKKCVLAEELGHHFTSSGIILDQRNIINVKQEKNAHIWAVKELITYEKYLMAVMLNHCDFCRAEYLDITEWFLRDAYYVYSLKINHYYYETSGELCYMKGVDDLWRA